MVDDDDASLCVVCWCGVVGVVYQFIENEKANKNKKNNK